MSDNLRIWDAVSKTDPAHTKKVNFGRTFTSIDAHWQVMQATKQFGPVGQGWGYTVEHSVERLSEQMVLAVADVTIWWRQLESHGVVGVDRVAQYGPIRATCEMWSPDKSGKMRVDEDAPKKAMTDALTKGLSHLGFSADVFLGLFDDNRYVQRLRREFANGEAEQVHVIGGNIPAVDPGDAHLVQGDGTSTYRLNAAKAAKEFADSAIGTLNLSGQTKDSLQTWWKANQRKLDGLEDRHPVQYERVLTAYDNAMEAAGAQAA